MNDEIKPGDVCEVVSCCCRGSMSLIGEEVTITSTSSSAFLCVCSDCGFKTTQFFELKFHDVDGAMPIAWLRKKPPKANTSQWIRQETIPREQFDTWLRKVRKSAPVKVYT